MAPSVRAPLGAALALLLAVGSLTTAASPAVLMVTLASVVLVAAGWPDLLELESAGGTRIVLLVTGVAGTLLAYYSPGELTSMQSIAAVCALGVFGSFIHQMARRDRSALTASLTGTVAGSMLTGLAACWVQAQHGAVASPGAHGIVTASAAGLCAALLVLGPPMRRAVAAPLAILAAAGVTTVVLTVLGSPVALTGCLLLGAVVGLGAAAAQSLLGSLLVARDPVASLAVAATPVATVGVVVLLAVRLSTHT